MKTNQNNEKTVPTRNKSKQHAGKVPVILELAHLVISLLCGNKPVSYSYKLVYQSTLLVGTMGDSRLGNQLADDSHRKASNINQSQTKRKTVWKKEN